MGKHNRDETSSTTMFDLTDAIDLHVHSSPDVYARSVSDDDLGVAVARYGMRGMLLKSHHTLTADRAQLLARRTGLTVFGGLALNLPVGGLNPVAAETAVEMGAAMIWMPTVHAANCLEDTEHPMFAAEVARGRGGISLFDDDGGLRADVHAIVEVVRDAEMALSTGHVSVEEGLALLALSHDMGVRQTVVTHPHMTFTHYPLEAMQQAVELGAMLEFDVLSCTPGWHGAVDPLATAAAISQVGVEHCVVASDGGQDWNPEPPHMLAAFATKLVEVGLDESSVRRLLTEQPARVLALA